MSLFEKIKMNKLITGQIDYFKVCYNCNIKCAFQEIINSCNPYCYIHNMNLNKSNQHQ